MDRAKASALHLQGIDAHGEYLRHVDGLRAVAVLSVILYHFDLSALPGGYVGVDVFFVISGFLITRLICNEIDATGTFDFVRFYLRRMRRLFPALFTTLLVSFVITAILYSPDQFARFGRSLTATVFWVSNIQFWKESGYFDAASHVKPLLHTWSLSVEEQFYFLWPALLWVLMQKLRLSRHATVMALIAAGGLSFLLNHLWVTGNFDKSYQYAIFFLTPFRVFEFVIGALAVFLIQVVRDKRVLQEAMMAAGLGMIAYAVVTYSEQIIFPYYFALLPCLGALLVILGGQSRYAAVIVSNKAAVATGLISYSLYLVHWPIVVFFKYWMLEAPTLVEAFWLLVLTFACATLLYFFVETPCRKGAPGTRKTASQAGFVATCIILMITAGGLGQHVTATAGWAWRHPEAMPVAQIEAGKAERFSLIQKSACTLARLEQPEYCKMDRPLQVLVMGNSHEPDGYNALAAAYGDEPSANLISFGSFNNCDETFENGRGVSRAGWSGCAWRVAKLSDPAFVSRLSVIAYSANKPFAGNKQVIWNIIGAMKKTNPKIRIVVLGGYLNTRHDCPELYNRTGSFAACREPRFLSYIPSGERESAQVRIPHGLDYLYIDKFALLCPDGLATCEVEANGEPFTYDEHHLSFGFASYFGRLMANRYGFELERAGFPAHSGSGVERAPQTSQIPVPR